MGPDSTFSNPQVASVGLTEAQAKDRGHNVKVGTFSFAENSRAVAMGETEGGIKVVSDSDSGEIFGVHIIGPEAAELIDGMSLAIRLEATVQDVGNMIYLHPTLSEVLKEASLDVDNRAIHKMKK